MKIKINKKNTGIKKHGKNPKIVKSVEIKEKRAPRIVKYENPTFKSLDELDMDDYSDYNDPNQIYIYEPKDFSTDYNGIKKFKIVGATYKKRNKKLYIIGENERGHKYLLNYDDNGVYSCGELISKQNWENSIVGSEYVGYRRSKWIKKSITDVLELGGKIYMGHEGW